MTEITCTYGRGWHPVRDTSNPSRDALSCGARRGGINNPMNWARYWTVRGRPLARLAVAEHRIAVEQQTQQAIATRRAA